MKKRNKIILWITFPLLSLLLIGGGITYMVNETIIKPMKQAEEKQKARKAAEIDFLKKNEPIITAYVKSLSDSSKEKITTVTYDWNDILETVSDASNPTATYDTLNLEGIYVNDDKDLALGVWVTPHDFNELDYISTMGFSDYTNKFINEFHTSNGWEYYSHG